MGGGVHPGVFALDQCFEPDFAVTDKDRDLILVASKTGRGADIPPLQHAGCSALDTGGVALEWRLSKGGGRTAAAARSGSCWWTIVDSRAVVRVEIPRWGTGLAPDARLLAEASPLRQGHGG